MLSPKLSPNDPVPALDRDTVIATLRAAGCVCAEEEARILLESAADRAELSTMIDRRVAGLPLEHVVGWVEFCGRRVAVDPGVFVPRRRTELLVRRAVALAPPGPTVVDLACGAGALGLCVAAGIGGTTTVHAVDIDPAAVRCARRNLAPLGGHAYVGDLYDPLPVHLRGRVDVLLANVPYVPTGAVDLLPREARLYEPLVALDGGADGLDVLRRAAGPARDWLAPGGHLLLEVSEDQAGAALAALAAAGLTADLVHDEDLDATVVVGRH